MLVFDDHPETLPVSVTIDASTGLPLLSEQRDILRHVTTHLALPYSIAEYGCGKRASLIIARLLELDIQPHAIGRGLAVERDMSLAALEECDASRRPHAMLADNPLWVMSNVSDPHLAEMLMRTSSDIRVTGQEIDAGPFHLRHAQQVQFVNSRSHVYPILWCWDEETGRALKHVVDPTLSRERLFELERIRELLHAPEAMVFTAPLLGHFRLDEAQLTAAQRECVRELLAGRRLDELSIKTHAELIRKMSGAEPGSVGDPTTWSYANNLHGDWNEHNDRQFRDTGRGDAFGELLAELLAAREAHESEIHQTRADLRTLTKESDVLRIVASDARWSAEKLEPLADVASTVVCYNALATLAEEVSNGTLLVSFLETGAQLERVRGIGVRLRRRIDLLARISEDDEGAIDARALNERFVEATIEAIRQMNLAGLTVAIDKVGNVHGMLLDEDAARSLRKGSVTIPDLLRHAIAFCSHLDTVKDAGRFDGRLGVLAGIETAHVLRDLQHYFGVETGGAAGTTEGVRILVSAFIGEEMTFTGRGVSMPGSAAVAGRAFVDDVHAMKNDRDERFGDRLLEMLREIARRQRAGTIEVVNEFDTDDGESLIAACFDPTAFFTPHTYERHIEQASVLDRMSIPLALVGTIMGIHQEDFVFTGEAAEAAALEMNLRLRGLASEAEFDGVRITVGILEPQGEAVSYERGLVAFRWTLEGEKNHAGATAIPERRDPGIAAARLARVLHGWLQTHESIRERGLRALVGNVNMSPGTNRNVIPGQVAFTLALVGGRLDRLEREDLEQSLSGYAIGTLAKSVPIGGEGMRMCRVEPISYANIATAARLSIDLRAGDQDCIRCFRTRIDDILTSLRDEYDVTIESEVQQQALPYALQRWGQVLLLERSYGGSHNPNEAELAADLTRGSILQLATTVDLLRRGRLEPSFNLFDDVERRIPSRWRTVLERYVSGALHDTCNIAACPRESLADSTPAT